MSRSSDSASSMSMKYRPAETHYGLGRLAELRGDMPSVQRGPYRQAIAHQSCPGGREGSAGTARSVNCEIKARRLQEN